MTTEQMRAAHQVAVERLHAVRTAIDEAGDDANLDELDRELSEAADEVERTRVNLEERERIDAIVARNPIPEAPEERERQVPVRTGAEELVYHQGNQFERSFFADAYRLRIDADPAARERLERHGRQMVDVTREKYGTQFRDVGTGAFAGLTVPQYLIDLFAPFARAGRPIANTCRSLPLPPSGMVLSISRITTATATAEQATENTAVQETDIDDTKLDVNVNTVTGQQDVSRQALERSEMVDAVVFQDLVEDYHTKLDALVIDGSGSSGQHLGILGVSGINSVAFTETTPSIAGFYPRLADAVQKVNAGRFLPATVVAMHPRRWGWLTSKLDDSDRPLVVPNSNGPYNALAVGQAAEYGQVVGTILGLPVVTDANLPTTDGSGTNEDVVIVYRAADLLLWEEGDGMPRQLRFEQTIGGSLTVKLVVYGYSAFTAGRYPKAVSAITGTGLATPTF